MATNYYDEKNLQERRENSNMQNVEPAKKYVDNYSPVSYNEFKDTASKNSNTYVIDGRTETGAFKATPIETWKTENQKTYAMAGDKTKESIDKGLLDAQDFMKDADEGTDIKKVQDASVKRQLAIDSNNKKLSDIATNEIIGHLSSENKEPYLKNAQPLQTYIDVKDGFDYKNGTYTTDRFLTAEPDENIIKIQENLNRLGYTDKYGNPLKEDGKVGAKTLYAFDQFESKNKDYSNAVKQENQTKNNYEIKRTSDGGVLSNGDEEYTSNVQRMIKCLSGIWKRSSKNSMVQEKIHKQAEKLRDFDDNSICQAVLLNNSHLASEFGHNAIMLINKDGCSVVFSFYPTNENIIEALDTDAEIRFSVLTDGQTKKALEGDYIYSMVATDGEIKTEQYNRHVKFDVESGENMLSHAVDLYDNPGKYRLFSRQCDDVATEILRKGGLDVDSKLFPDITYWDLHIKENINRIIDEILSK